MPLVGGFICILTHWSGYIMTTMLQATISNAFYWLKTHGFQISFHLNIFPRIQLTTNQYWFRLWLGAEQATRHYWTNDGMFYWRMNASLGFNELSNQSIWIRDCYNNFGVWKGRASTVYILLFQYQDTVLPVCTSQANTSCQLWEL